MFTRLWYLVDTFGLKSSRIICGPCASHLYDAGELKRTIASNHQSRHDVLCDCCQTTIKANCA